MLKIKNTFIFLLISAFMSTSAFAADAVTFDATNNDGGYLHGDDEAADADSPLIGKLSAGVSVSCKTSDTTYALATKHKNGTKVYGASSGANPIYVEDTDVFTGNITNSDTTDFNGWDEL
jgi:hypothetical protein